MIAALVIVAYFAAMLAIGIVAERRTRDASAEEYYLAGRRLGPIALFFALFGTNCSPFVLMGIPGQSYHDGIGIFSLNAPIIALGIPLTFWLFGIPARAMSQRLGALSPAELVAKRLDSRAVGIVLFVTFTAFTLPYMVTGIQGCAIALSQTFPTALSPRAGAALSLGVALAYTLLGGMRATAWTNVVQGALFLGIVVLALLVVIDGLDGWGAAFSKLVETRPELTVLDESKPRLAPRAFASYGLAITLTVVCFPHMLVRLMAAGGGNALRTSCRLYPFALGALWLPCVLLGVFGALVVPGLVGSQSDAIFPRMIDRFFAPEFAVLGTLAVLAAAMSTLDAQLLTLGSMLSRDVRRDDSRGSPAERLFLLGVGIAVYALYELVGALDLSIFALAQFSFSGYVMLFPTLALVLLWRRFTAAGAITSVVAGCAYLLAAQRGSVPSFGFLPVLPAFTVAAVVAMTTSLLTSPPRKEVIAVAFGDR